MNDNGKGDGSIDYDVIPGIAGYLPTASPSEQSTRIGKWKWIHRYYLHFLSHLIVKNEDRIQNFAYRNSHNGFEPISYPRLAQKQELLSFILFVCRKSS